jgi:hypothetical protein
MIPLLARLAEKSVLTEEVYAANVVWHEPEGDVRGQLSKSASVKEAGALSRSGPLFALIHPTS